MGMLCCACSAANRKWYRAVVKEVISPRKVCYSLFPPSVFLSLSPSSSLLHWTDVSFHPHNIISSHLLYLQVRVEFVDYGNKEVIERTKLRKKLNHHLSNLPFQVHAAWSMIFIVWWLFWFLLTCVQAVKCTLHGLPPPNVSLTLSLPQEGYNAQQYMSMHLTVVCSDPQCQWTETAIDSAMQFLEVDNIYLKVRLHQE